MHDARELTRHLADLLRRERTALSEFLVALAAFDRGKRWRDLGHTSLFYFLHRELGLSKSAAFHRKTAAELLQRYPEIVAPLQDGRLCLSSVAELAKVITPENRHGVVARFFHASAREAKVISAELCPVEAPPRREVVTRVQPASPARVAAPLTTVPSIDPAQSVSTSEPVLPAGTAPGTRPAPEPAPAPTARPPDFVEPLTADLRRVHLTVTKRFLAKLEAARETLSHSHPGADGEAVLEAALDLFLAKDARRKGLVKNPRPAPSKPSANPRHIPAAVRRAVWIRDEGKCQYRLASGESCGSTHRLELDHVVPVALGGPSTVENVRLTCAPHNQLAARELFGGAWMDRFTERGGGGARRQPA